MATRAHAILTVHGNEKRDRDQALRRLSQYSDGVFRRRFKLTRKRFWSLLDVLRPDLELDDLGQRKARNSSGSPVPPECKLAVTLRWLAGSNFANAEDLYGVVHIGHPNAKKVKNVKHYRNRKKFFSINLQAVADAHRRIIYYDLSTAGSTHDSLAWKMSPMRAGKDGVYLDNFNFYQSRIRINIECAFGLLVAKFGILRRAMTGTMEHNTVVVYAKASQDIDA
eukprot:jgi/Tetstr1/460926/TSEL_006078.t1